MVLRDREVRQLLSHVAVLENRVFIACRGRDPNLANQVWSLGPVVRTIAQYAIVDDAIAPVVSLTGTYGVGKSWVLQELERRIRDLMPDMMVFRGTGDDVLSQLYNSIGGAEELSSEELRLVPVLPRAAETLGGVVLLVDDEEVAWLCPMRGVRIIKVAGGSPGASHSSTLEIKEFNEQEQGEFAASTGLPAHPCPLWSTLAAPHLAFGVSELYDIEQLIAFVLSKVPIVAKQCLVVTRGLTHDEAAACGCAPLMPLLRTTSNGMLLPTPHLKRHIRTLAGDEMSAEVVVWMGDAHAACAAFFLAAEAGARSEAERRAEAAWHMMQCAPSDDNRAQLLSLVTDWVVIEVLSKSKTDLCLVAEHLGADVSSLRTALSRECSPRQRMLLGEFLSTCGQFAAAREELVVAREALAGGRERGCACSLIAFNEVRYWDSRRDWKNVDELRLLLDSSEEAVQLLRSARTVAEKMELAQALTRHANGSFKAACVSSAEDDVTWQMWLDRSRVATDEVQKMLARCPPSGVLGRAMLVAGVALLVRGDKLRDAGEPHRKILAAAAKTFMTSEIILCKALGPVNESSIYTHGNLAEFYLYRLRDLRKGIVAFYESCYVGIHLLGPTHPNVASKLQEFSSILSQLGLPPGLCASIEGGKLPSRNWLSAIPRLDVSLDAWEAADPALAGAQTEG